LATIKLTKGSRSKTLFMFGKRLNRDAIIEVEAVDALRVFGDSNLDITFAESDRKDLKQIDPKMLTRLTKAFGKVITTHDELCKELLPAKTKAKKAPAKPKKSALKE
jgi:hypothetical protein